jgi:hypothetical protein
MADRVDAKGSPLSGRGISAISVSVMIATCIDIPKPEATVRGKKLFGVVVCSSYLDVRLYPTQDRLPQVAE